MKNFKLVVSYDGTRYFGWEHQPDTDLTIQGKLESVLSQMLDLPEGETVTVIGAGRTDAGVHARAMTCNVLLDTEKSEDEIQAYMNRYLPDDISVNSVKQAADRFHSRFKAIGKTYRYTCWYGPTKPVFDRRYVTVLEREPDVDRMREAAEYLTGMHDYRSFCGNTRMNKSTIRVVDVIRSDPDRAERQLYPLLLPRKRLSAEYGQDHDGNASGGRLRQERTGGYGRDPGGQEPEAGRLYGARAGTVSDEG